MQSYRPNIHIVVLLLLLNTYSDSLSLYSRIPIVVCYLLIRFTSVQRKGEFHSIALYTKLKSSQTTSQISAYTTYWSAEQYFFVTPTHLLGPRTNDTKRKTLMSYDTRTTHHTASFQQTITHKLYIKYTHVHSHTLTSFII